MKHRPIDRLKEQAGVITVGRMPRNERLARWANVLEREAGRPLSTLRGTELRPPAERAAMRADGSSLSLAWQDPVLRSAGLRNDGFGEASRFFGLSDWELHTVVCYCHFGETVRAEDAAARVRALVGPAQPAGRSGIGWMIAGGALAGLALALVL